MAASPDASLHGSSLALSGQKVLVVGTGPMGLATARAALAADADVVLSGRSARRLADARDAVPGVITYVADPESDRETDALVAACTPLDHVVVLAGGRSVSAARGLRDTPVDTAQQSFARLWLSYNVLRAASTGLEPGGSVVLLSGSSSRRPSEGRGFWGTLHGAIEALGRNAAWELAPLRVNVLSPGGIGLDSPMRQLVPHRGQPEDVASMAIALMTNPAITGALVDVDGGEFLGDLS